MISRGSKPRLRTAASLALPLALLVVCLAVEARAILALNDGHLVFTLDDAYIHLALAENLGRGTYGINLGEVSSPASSILWPLLLVPFAHLESAPWILLALNALFAVAALLVYRRIILLASSGWHGSDKPLLVGFLTALLALATNLVGVTLTGMEHTLQVLLTALLILGLFQEAESRLMAWWLVPVIVLGPLVRYENLALSLPALVCLWARRHRRAVAASAVALVGTVGGFSLFLVSQGQSVLPSSVLTKSVVGSDWTLLAAIANAPRALADARGVLLAMGGLILLLVMASPRQIQENRLLACVTLSGILLHLFFGQYGWFFRYELYIWTALLLTLLLVYRHELARALELVGSVRVVAAAALLVGVTCGPYLWAILVTPLASNNIYEQQYQVHRFAVEYLGAPLAANDIGYVSYRNEEYVLDLWGLSSADSLQSRQTEEDPEWMDAAARCHGVQVAILYDEWFPEVPESWTPVARMALGKARITPAESAVTFYITDLAARSRVLDLLEQFRGTLPDGVDMDITE